MTGPGRPAVGLSVDVDSVASHLEGYGHREVRDDGSAYREAVPRALELFARDGARATFFLIAGEARRHPDVVARIVAEGHEVASHSLTHRLPFRGLDEDALRVEVSGSKAALEALAGEEVQGFRAPSWDVDPALLARVAGAGYRYDASAYPSILLPFLRASIARRGSREAPPSGRSTWEALKGPSGIHLRRVGGRVIVEVPMCTTPGARLPYYHTLRFVAPEPVFRLVRRLAHARRGPVWYQFHAVDFQALRADRLDPRIGCHPGMDLALERKLELAAEAVAALARRGRIVPLRDLARERWTVETGTPARHGKERCMDEIRLPTERDASGRSFGAEEMALLREVIESGVLFGPNGTKVRAFEEELQALFGVLWARAVSSGSAAVHTALAALDVAPGDEVVTTPITDMGAVSPILFQGAIPVFADVDPDTLNLTAATIRPRLTERTRAIVVTHLFGNPCDMDPILELARDHGVAVLEDAAQAYLATYRGRLAGTMGDVAAFSLQQTKHITCGEGGFVLTADEGIARRARVWADKGWNYAPVDPDHDFLGLNYRMSELQGAVALAQLRKIRGLVETRVAMAERLAGRIAGIRGLRPLPATPEATQTWWRFVVLVDADVVPGGPAALAGELRSLGVWSTPNYIRVPAFMCRQFRERATFRDTGHPYALHGDRYPIERVEEYPGCREGLARVLVLPWTERHGPRHVELLAERIAEAAERLVVGAPEPRAIRA